jgi:hypothetical protein
MILQTREGLLALNVAKEGPVQGPFFISHFPDVIYFPSLESQ